MLLDVLITAVEPRGVELVCLEAVLVLQMRSQAGRTLRPLQRPVLRDAALTREHAGTPLRKARYMVPECLATCTPHLQLMQELVRLQGGTAESVSAIHFLFLGTLDAACSGRAGEAGAEVPVCSRAPQETGGMCRRRSPAGSSGISAKQSAAHHQQVSGRQP